ncbi:hypothetical protein FDP41_012590 [Naegleria fowleri]|uniref:HMG box domain-containing protein n=1 Tax=Naegleria fowleri TaxID=5763 RepID=A0A6A5C678_NAEFO|nr:uncharacterized protein FDP41_012590 [Naegleria fowleri]KAF0981330.1 hypothetical protein FDP41_012590 [Naegleria fowleri]CAG4717252.1 unnamed protein product [Naegleria fowleri]
MSELKRPASSYILFCNDHRAEVKTKLGENAKPKEVQKELSKLWNDASEATKEKYKKLYEENKADYNKKAEALKVVEEDNKTEQESSGRTLRKRPPKKVAEEEPKKKKTKAKGESKPRGMTGYNLYMKENKEKLKSDKLEGKKLTEKVRKMWNNLAEDEKKKYNERAAKLAPEKKDEAGSASDE